MAQPYSTASQVKSKTISVAITDASWADSDIETRITAADRIIDSLLAAIGYDLPFTTNPVLVTELSILYSRYRVLNDIYTENSNDAGLVEEAEKYKKEFDEIIKRLQDGDASLLDSSGNIIDADGRIQVDNAAEDVPRALDMGDPEDLGEIDDTYYDDDIKGI